MVFLFWLLSSPSSLSSSAIKYSYLYLCQCNPLEGDPILRGPVPRLNPAPDHLHLGPPGVSRQHGLACSTGFQFASCSALRANFAIKYPPLHCTGGKGNFSRRLKKSKQGETEGSVVVWPWDSQSRVVGALRMDKSEMKWDWASFGPDAFLLGLDTIMCLWRLRRVFKLPLSTEEAPLVA